MYDEHAAYLIFGIENQANIHYAMPVKNMLYDAGQYAKQVEQAAASKRRSKGQGEEKKVSSAEFLSGFYKEDHLLPVITLVIYWNADEWDGPLSLHEMFEEQDEEILAFVPDYKINLIVPQQIQDEDFGKFKTTLAEAFQYIKYSKDGAALKQVLKDNRKFRTLDRKTVDVINVVTGSNIKVEEEQEEVDVCVAIEEIKQEAAKEAAEKAAKEAVVTMVGSIRNLMDTLKLTADQAMEALKIPECDRKIYLNKL